MPSLGCSLSAAQIRAREAGRRAAKRAREARRLAKWNTERDRSLRGKGWV